MVLGIVLAVLPMTWWLKLVLIIGLAGIVADLSFHAPWTVRLKKAIKWVICIAGISVVALLCWKAVLTQYTEDTEPQTASAGRKIDQSPIPRQPPKAPDKTEPSQPSPFTPLAKRARALAPEISGFILTRQPPPIIQSPDANAQNQRMYDDFQHETSVLFAQKFSTQLTALAQELRTAGLADYRFDWDIAWLAQGDIFGDLSERLELIADRLGSKEGIDSLRLPYHRHIMPDEVARLHQELSGYNGHLLIACPNDDPESKAFATELYRAMHNISGWTVEPVFPFQMQRFNLSDSSTGIDVLGTPGSRATDKLQRALREIRVTAGFRTLSDPQLGGTKLPPDVDVVLLIQDIPQI